MLDVSHPFSFDFVFRVLACSLLFVHFGCLKQQWNLWNSPNFYFCSLLSEQNSDPKFDFSPHKMSLTLNSHKPRAVVETIAVNITNAESSGLLQRCAPTLF